MEAIAIVTVIALLQYTVFSMLVGKTRRRVGISAPAMVGNDELERYIRVQMNTLEQLIILIPAMWLFGIYVHALIGAALGMVFIIGRVLYFKAYINEPSKRTLGFVSGFLVCVVLMVGSLVGAVMKLMA